MLCCRRARYIRTGRCWSSWRERLQPHIRSRKTLMIQRTLSRLLRSVVLLVWVSLLTAACSMSPAESGAPATRSQARAISSSIYVAKSQGFSSKNAVLVYAPKTLKLERTIMDGIKGGFAGTQGLSVDASGDLYVASYSTNSIIVYAPGRSSPSYTITKGIPDPIAWRSTRKNSTGGEPSGAGRS